jgi:ferric-dicitrate binding protein FerR (iron transport regulator)
MFRKHVTRQLSAYHHQEVSASEKLNIEAHLQTCSRCRAAYGEIRLGARLASSLKVSPAPASVWPDLSRTRPASSRRRWVPLASLAALALTLLFLVVHRTQRPSWEVTGLPGTSRLRLGETLQTSAASEAQIKIANIGNLIVSPNSQIRLLVSKSDQHRIALDRGKIEAQTWSPPRLFIVDTPAASAVDLGCRYTLQVQPDGSSLLHVTLGLVALQRDNEETIVPAGAFCRTRKGDGPGTPYFEDASADLQAAVAKIDSLDDGPERLKQIEVVVRESHIRDALTLWHLIPRVDTQARGMIYDRLAQLLPPPPEVTRDGIVALNPKMLDAWRRVVSQLWQ